MSRTPADEPIARARLPRHPRPTVLARQLRELAKQLERDGRTAIDTAELLAARGFPTGTSGTPSRSADDTSSVERAAGVNQLTPIPTSPRWADIDRRLATLLRLLWKAGLDTETLIADVLAHGDDIDHVPVGTGACQACDHLCQPAKNPNDRLRGGLCDACRKAWERAGKPMPKSDWRTQRRRELHGSGDNHREQRVVDSPSPIGYR